MNTPTPVPAGTLSPERLRAESRKRIDAACRKIEEAQNLLNDATADLSTLYGCVSVWKGARSMADKVRDLWYRVDKVRQSGRFKLDDFHVQCIVERDASSAKALAASAPFRGPLP